METPPQHQTETDPIDLIIGMNKYADLKSRKPEDLTPEEKKQIELFEAKRNEATPEQLQANHDYFERILKDTELKPTKINARTLWDLFKANFQIVNSRPFIKIENVTIANLEPLIYYFTKDERFFKCANLSNVSEPSFDKGLLIIGNFGNGKTATMKTFEAIFKNIDGFAFKGYSANEVVTMFEACSSDIDREEFNKKMYRGTRYFDDLKTERIASNYGKVNLFKEVLEERYSRFYPTKTSKEKKRKLKTYITANYKDGFPDNMQMALEEFSEKYGERVFDRVFEMFNVIEFKGKSFRK
jgi:DNA replication protein DnaC